MTTLKTPTLNTKGLYTLTEPFTALVTANVAYAATAIRSFNELIAAGVDIFTTYYAPVGLLQSNYTDDLAVGASIVTLMADGYAPVYVPDTYMADFPQVGNVSYSTPIMAINLGPLPDGFDLSSLNTQLTNLVAATVGVVAAVSVYIVPSPTVLSQAAAANAETARKAAITADATDYATLLALQINYDALQTKYNALASAVAAQP